MRLTGDSCGWCHTRKPFYKRLGFYVMVMAVPLAGVGTYVVTHV